jgi:hypothetical protein
MKNRAGRNAGFGWFFDPVSQPRTIIAVALLPSAFGIR